MKKNKIKYKFHYFTIFFIIKYATKLKKLNTDRLQNEEKNKIKFSRF